MIAVNHPNVVLGAATVKFLKPTKQNDKAVAEATVKELSGKKHSVEVVVFCEEEKVFEGTFVCFVLDKHVLE
jgi:acyl-coenzyme A thioesterase PaaI-like protein